MNFKSLHAYLDHVFRDRDTVSEPEIIAAKNDYWRAYNTALKKRQRALHREFSVRFSHSEFDSFKEYLNGKPVSSYIRKAVLGFDTAASQKTYHYDTSLVEQQLFLMSQLLEEISQTYDVPTYLFSDMRAALSIIESELKAS